MEKREVVEMHSILYCALESNKFSIFTKFKISKKNLQQVTPTYRKKEMEKNQHFESPFCQLHLRKIIDLKCSISCIVLRKYLNSLFQTSYTTR